MSIVLTPAEVAAITKSIAPDRLSRYAAPPGNADTLYPLKLYNWNAQVSGAFIPPLQICEVVMRNAIAEAIESIYGPAWPWESAFECSLPNPAHGHSLRAELLKARAITRHQHTPKVIPELPLYFWSQMLTSRHDTRIWNHHLLNVFPNLPAGTPVQSGRGMLHQHMESIRKFRNRIAHHEHIFNAPLTSHLALIRELVAYRCQPTLAFLDQVESVTDVLGKRP